MHEIRFNDLSYEQEHEDGSAQTPDIGEKETEIRSERSGGKRHDGDQRQRRDEGFKHREKNRRQGTEITELFQKVHPKRLGQDEKDPFLDLVEHIICFLAAA